MWHPTIIFVTPDHQYDREKGRGRHATDNYGAVSMTRAWCTIAPYNYYGAIDK